MGAALPVAAGTSLGELVTGDWLNTTLTDPDSANPIIFDEIVFSAPIGLVSFLPD
jgi:hypothetical protein